uniref:Transposase, Ptta/En/Spm, plant n=2 Tax=Zea mays TaxID=4577 RepID=A0A804R465_MAIZE
MPPGRMDGARTCRDLGEVPITEYEKERALNVMRNNKMLSSLGITGLTSLIRSSSTRKNSIAREDFDPLYEPDHSEDNDHHVANQDDPFYIERRNTNMSTGFGGTKGSKRVVAPNVEDQVGRVTRQKTKELSLVEKDIHGLTANTDEHTLISANFPAHHDDEIQMCDEDVMTDKWIRGKSMGRQLERISRGLNTKIPLVITEGNRRPEVPMQAAMLASEGGIVIRQHMPILTHWKEYKNDKSYLEDFVGRIGGQFAIDTKNKDVKYACADLMRCNQRQMRYKLKKAYFNGVAADKVRTTSPLSTMTDEQWMQLVNMWSTPKHKEKCVNNKVIRGKVRFQQKTGSRSYIAHMHAVKQAKYGDAPPSAIDLFKECHCSRKTGFAEPVKEAIDTMEALVAEPGVEGKESKTPTEAVAQVLSSSKFLYNIGLVPATKKSCNGGDPTRVAELEAELESEKQNSLEVRAQLDALKKKVEESEEARAKELEKINDLQKGADETNALLRRLFSLNK